jgi:hypothetical protein
MIICAARRAQACFKRSTFYQPAPTIQVFKFYRRHLCNRHRNAHTSTLFTARNASCAMDTGDQLAILRNYAQYQRKRRREEPDDEPHALEMKVDAAGDEQAAGAYDESGFNTASLCCTRCHTLKPSTDFYQSCLARKAFYCKRCSSKRSKMAQDINPVTDEQLQPSPLASDRTLARKKPIADVALRLLNQLRRKCHKPSRLLQRVQGRTIDQPCTIAFDVKVTRNLLDFWERRSAIPDTLENKLELLIWTTPEDRIIQPWHVIPVTHSQARRLRLVRTVNWPHIVAPQALALIDQRLSHLKQLFDAHADTPAL